MYVKQLMRELTPEQPTPSMEELNVVELDLLKDYIDIDKDVTAVASLESLANSCGDIITQIEKDVEFTPAARMMANYAMLQMSSVTGYELTGVSMESNPATVSTNKFNDVVKKIIETITRVIKIIYEKAKRFASRITLGHKALRTKAVDMKRIAGGLSGAPHTDHFKVNDSVVSAIATGGSITLDNVVEGVAALEEVGTYLYGTYTDFSINHITQTALINVKPTEENADMVGKMRLITAFNRGAGLQQVGRELAKLSDRHLPGGYNLSPELSSDGLLTFDTGLKGTISKGNQVQTLKPNDIIDLLDAVIGITDLVLAKGRRIEEFNKARNNTLSQIRKLESNTNIVEVQQIGEEARRQYENILMEYGKIAFSANKGVLAYVLESMKQYDVKGKLTA